MSTDGRDRLIQKEGTAALLDSGVSVPLLEIRLPFKKRPLQVRVTLRRPTLGGVIRIAREYLKLGVTAETLEAMSKEKQMLFMAEHGKELSRMVALTICRGVWSSRLLVGITAWWVRRFMKKEYLDAAWRSFVLELGTEDFRSIISSAGRMNPMKPRLSHERKGS